MILKHTFNFLHMRTHLSVKTIFPKATCREFRSYRQITKICSRMMKVNELWGWWSVSTKKQKRNYFVTSSHLQISERLVKNFSFGPHSSEMSWSGLPENELKIVRLFTQMFLNVNANYLSTNFLGLAWFSVWLSYKTECCYLVSTFSVPRILLEATIEGFRKTSWSAEHSP